MTMDMPENVDTAITRFSRRVSRHSAVGGCVRDSLLGKFERLGHNDLGEAGEYEIRVCRLSLHRHGHKARTTKISTASRLK